MTDDHKPGCVKTSYGWLPGCPECEVITLGSRPVLCEHGVTPGFTPELSFDVIFDDGEAYTRFLYGRHDGDSD